MTETVCQEERVGVYPGSFDPPTIAHLAIADQARLATGLDRVEFVVSRRALAKENADNAPFDLRIAVIRESIAGLDWLSLRVTELRFIADIAQGFAAVIMGADKWAQVVDPVFYGGDPSARDAAVERLPQVVGPNRPGAPPLPDSAVVIELTPELAAVSSSGARAGRLDWMTPPARLAATAHRIWSG